MLSQHPSRKQPSLFQTAPNSECLFTWREKYEGNFLTEYHLITLTFEHNTHSLLCASLFLGVCTLCGCKRLDAVCVFRRHRLRLFSLGVSFRSRKCKFRSERGIWAHLVCPHLFSYQRPSKSPGKCMCVHKGVCVSLCEHKWHQDLTFHNTMCLQSKLREKVILSYLLQPFF